MGGRRCTIAGTSRIPAAPTLAGRAFLAPILAAVRPMARLPDLRACETGRGPKLVGAHGVHRRPPQGSWHFLFARAAVYIFRACLETKCKRRAAPASCLTLVLVMVEVGPSDRDGARGQQRSGRARANQVQQGARNAMKISACVAQAVGTLEWWPRAPGVLTFVSTRTVVLSSTSRFRTHPSLAARLLDSMFQIGH